MQATSGRAPPAAKDGDAVSLGGRASTDAATARDVGPPSRVTGPHRRRRAGVWEATVAGPERLDLGGSL